MKVPVIKVGDAFGQLLVIDVFIGKDGKNCTLCICSCNEMIEKFTSELRSFDGKVGHGRYCSIRNALSSFRNQYRNYGKGAKGRDLEFELNFEDFLKIINKPCYYCNSGPIYKNAKSLVKNGVVTSANGIDRLDNNKGYVEGNMVPCCSICNMMKRSMSEFNFKLQCIAIAKNIKGKDDEIQYPKLC